MKTVRCSIDLCGGCRLMVVDESDLTLEMVEREVIYYSGTGDFYRRADPPLTPAELNRKCGIFPCHLMVTYHRKQHPAVCLFGLRIPADRLAFFCDNNGRWPAPDSRVKHIDGDHLNNRNWNLREMFPAEVTAGGGIGDTQSLKIKEKREREQLIRYRESVNAAKPGFFDIDAEFGTPDENGNYSQPKRNGMLYDRYLNEWRAYDESDSGLGYVICRSEAECVKERDMIRRSAAINADMEAQKVRDGKAVSP